MPLVRISLVKGKPPESCGKWLDSGAKTGYEKFCPNAEFIRELGGRAAR